MDKSPDAFRTISEVADDLDLPQHVLRFWETRFSQIRPLKRGGGRRYYRPDDVELLKGIRYLLYGEGYTIRGVQRILKEQGLKVVMSMGRDDVSPAMRPSAGDEPFSPRERETVMRAAEPPSSPSGEPVPSVPPSPGFRMATPIADSPFIPRARIPFSPHVEPEVDPPPPVPRAPAEDTLRPEPRRGLFGILPAILAGEDDSTPVMPRITEPTQSRLPETHQPEESRPVTHTSFAPVERQPEPRAQSETSAAPSVAPPYVAPPSTPRPPIQPAVGAGGRLPSADINRLKATLFELTECRRLLDAAREVEQ